MQINITTPALLFPAISLLLLAYTNRFLALASLIRGLAGKIPEKDTYIQKQIANLRLRIQLIKFMQAFGIAAFTFCVISMILLFLNKELAGRSVFGVSLFLMLISLSISFWETLVSGKALRYELKRYEDIR
ncbi:MAG: DUF2721 domain-containing protein [Leptospiraceae bacterium]|nr:DUF2721 domain-containing protein [Leptospiraceae bacterium]MCP5499511.1 DUF2721 domain-containing protein [Leptospiraceae bacterium]